MGVAWESGYVEWLEGQPNVKAMADGERKRYVSDALEQQRYHRMSKDQKKAYKRQLKKDGKLSRLRLFNWIDRNMKRKRQNAQVHKADRERLVKEYAEKQIMRVV